MAQPKDFFGDVLATIENEQERAAMRAVLEKNPATKTLVANVNRFATDGEGYATWYRDKWPEYETAHKTLPTVQAQLAEANKTIETLQGKSGNQPPNKEGELFDMAEMTQEQLNKLFDDRIKAQGFVTKAEAEQMALQAAAGVKVNMYDEGLPMIEQMMSLGRRFEADFPSKKWDGDFRLKFNTYLAENKGVHRNLAEAYDAFFRSDYNDKMKADAFAQGEATGMKKAQDQFAADEAARAGRSLPVDMIGANGVPGNPTAPPTPVELDKIPTDYDISKRGDSALEFAIAAQVRKDRAAGKQV